jgi:hypothetical protein
MATEQDGDLDKLVSRLLFCSFVFITWAPKNMITFAKTHDADFPWNLVLWQHFCLWVFQSWYTILINYDQWNYLKDQFMKMCHLENFDWSQYRGKQSKL